MGTLVATGPCFAFSVELFLAFVEGDEMCLCGVPCFVDGGFQLPSLHFLVVKHVQSVHAFDIVLDLGGIGCGYADVAAEFLLLVEFTGKLHDVGQKISLDVKGGSGLLLLERGNNAPFGTKMFENGLDVLGSVTDVVVVEFFNVCGIDGFAYYLVHDDGVDALLFPELLAFKVVISHDASSVGESCVVCEVCRDNGRYDEARRGERGNVGDGAVLRVVENESKIAVSSAPARCFDGCGDLGELLFHHVHGGIRRLANDFFDWHGCDDGVDGFADGSFVGCG